MLLDAADFALVNHLSTPGSAYVVAALFVSHLSNSGGAFTVDALLINCLFSTSGAGVLSDTSKSLLSITSSHKPSSALPTVPVNVFILSLEAEGESRNVSRMCVSVQFVFVGQNKTIHRIALVPQYWINLIFNMFFIESDLPFPWFLVAA